MSRHVIVDCAWPRKTIRLHGGPLDGTHAKCVVPATIWYGMHNDETVCYVTRDGVDWDCEDYDFRPSPGAPGDASASAAGSTRSRE